MFFFWIVPVTGLRIQSSLRSKIPMAIQSAMDEGVFVRFVVGVDEGSVKDGSVEAVALTESEISENSIVLGMDENFLWHENQSESGCGRLVNFAGRLLQGLAPKQILYWWDIFASTENYLTWSHQEQLLVKKSLFSNIVAKMEADLACLRFEMSKIDYSRKMEDLVRALSFAALTSQTGSKGLTVLPALFAIAPNSEFANVAPDPSNPLVFRAIRKISPGEILSVDMGLSNLEIYTRFGFDVIGNSYAARSFELLGEPLQARCPSISLHSGESIIKESLINCHKEARYRTFSGKYQNMTINEQLKEDVLIDNGISDACGQM